MDTYKRRSIKRIDRCISKVLKRTNTDYRFIGRVVTDFLVTNRFQVGDVIGGQSFYNLFIVIRTTPRMIVYNHLLTSERMKSRVIDDHVMFDRVLLLKKCDFKEVLENVLNTKYTHAMITRIRENYERTYAYLKRHNFSSL